MMKFELSQEFKDWRDSKPEYQEHVRKWAEALLTSKQFKGLLYYHKQPERMCCLGVSCAVEGQSVGEMSTLMIVGNSLANPIRGISQEIHDIAATSTGKGFAKLNDKHLTHPQISQLLAEGYVEVEA